MPLKICYENIVKIVCNYHFLKKKKWNGIVAMALPNSIPLFTIQKFFFYPLFRQWHCHKPIAKKFFPSYFGNDIWICAHNFYNIFITNFKWQVVIVRLKKVISVLNSNLNY